MKILIINLTRMGDLIQTTGLINEIYRTYPEAQTDILVMKAFSPIVKHFEHINEIICLNDEILNANLSDNIWEAYHELFDVVSKLNNKKYDVLFNPIVSEQSALLTFLINAKKKLGLQKTKNNEQKMTSDFIAYQLANEHKLGDFCFNLVDIFAGSVGTHLCCPSVGTHLCSPVAELPSADCKTFISGGGFIHSTEKSSSSQTTPPVIANSKLQTRKLSLSVHDTDIQSISPFIEKIKAHGKPIIGFHIGASQSNKAWNIKYYHQVITKLLKEENHVLVLFGGYKEKDYKHFFDNIRVDLFFNTIGDFNLDELIAAISNIDLLVTNDTGPMHIAVALDKPIIDISLGPVSKWETGPYIDKAIIIQARLDCYPCDFDFKCSHHNCHHVITPDLVVELIKANMGSANPPTFMGGSVGTHLCCPLAELPSAVCKTFISGRGFVLSDFVGNADFRIYTTYFDQFGFHSVRPLIKEKITKIEYIYALKRFIWSLYFVNKLDEYKDFYLKYLDDIKNDYLLIDFSFIELKKFISELIDKTTTIINNLKLINSHKKNHNKNNQFLMIVKKEKLDLFDKANEFELIIDWFNFTTYKESQIDDFDLQLIVKKTIALYDTLRKKLTLFKDLLP